MRALLLAVVLVRHVDRRPVKALRLDRAALRACLAGFALVAGAVAIATLVAAWFGLTVPGEAFPWSAWPLLIVQAFVPQAIPEEILLRGYLVQTALGRLPRWGVIALSVLLFGVLHLASRSAATTLTQRLLFLLFPIGFAVMATILRLAAGGWRLAAGSVWPAVAVHGGFHVSVYATGLWVMPAPESHSAYLIVLGGALLLASAVLISTGRTVSRWCSGPGPRTGPAPQNAHPLARMDLAPRPRPDSPGRARPAR